MMRKITNLHVSQRGKYRTIKQLELRLRLLKRLETRGIAPERFIAYHSDKKMCNYTSGIFEKISLNAAKKQKELWEELKKQMKLYAAHQRQVVQGLAKKEDTHTGLPESNSNKSPKSRTKAKLEQENRHLNRQIQVLTNDLIQLRGMYLDLLNKTKDAEHLAQRHRDAIQRHKDHFGLTLVSDKN